MVKIFGRGSCFLSYINMPLIVNELNLSIFLDKIDLFQIWIFSVTFDQNILEEIFWDEILTIVHRRNVVKELISSLQLFSSSFNTNSKYVDKSLGSIKIENYHQLSRKCLMPKMFLGLRTGLVNSKSFQVR